MSVEFLHLGSLFVALPGRDDVASFDIVASKTKEPEMNDPLVCVFRKTNTSIAQGDDGQ
jgi:hypothetical protein